MKRLLIVLIVLSACNKQPVKECWTVEGYKIVQVVPSIYQVTLKSGNKTKLIRQSRIPIVGSNSCEENNIIESRF